jgi:hypothetical protein
VDLEVDRHQLDRTRLVDEPPGALEAGEARIAVERFAFTANNVTYAVFGDLLRYWEVFPAGASDDATVWGRIPVWGYGRIVESRSPELAVDRRVFGYLPMSTDFTVTPGRLDDRGFTDLAPHRAELAGAYNRYSFADTDPIHRDDREPHRMLLFPLFFTAFVVDDVLADLEDEIEQVWLSSASAKTSIGVAFQTRQRGVAAVGLTSERNRAFVEDLDIYTQVVTYAEVATVPRGRAAYVDVAGNDDVTRAVHAHLGDALTYSMRVGGTHWDHEADTATGEPLPGPTPEFFFAPTQLAKRARDWGQDVLDARVASAWEVFADWADGWLRFEGYEGAKAVESAYREVLANQADPRSGHLCTLVSGTEAPG